MESKEGVGHENDASCSVEERCSVISWAVHTKSAWIGCSGVVVLSGVLVPHLPLVSPPSMTGSSSHNSELHGKLAKLLWHCPGTSGHFHEWHRADAIPNSRNENVCQPLMEV